MASANEMWLKVKGVFVDRISTGVKEAFGNLKRSVGPINGMLGGITGMMGSLGGATGQVTRVLGGLVSGISAMGGLGGVLAGVQVAFGLILDHVNKACAAMKRLAQRAAMARAARVEPMRPNEDERRRAKRMADGMLPRIPGDRWDCHAYARAIRRVCEDLGIPHWSPNQLRHTCATEVRRRFGLAAARAVLGHSAGGMMITDRYSFEAAEDEALRDATPAMLALG